MTLKNSFRKFNGQVALEYILVFIAIAVGVILVFKGISPVDTYDASGVKVATEVSTKKAFDPVINAAFDAINEK